MAAVEMWKLPGRHFPSVRRISSGRYCSLASISIEPDRKVHQGELPNVAEEKFLHEHCGLS